MLRQPSSLNEADYVLFPETPTFLCPLSSLAQNISIFIYALSSTLSTQSMVVCPISCLSCSYLITCSWNNFHLSVAVQILLRTPVYAHFLIKEAFNLVSSKCRLFELSAQETSMKLSAKEAPSLQSVGLQTCVAFSVDGCKLGLGGEVRRTLISRTEWERASLCPVDFDWCLVFFSSPPSNKNYKNDFVFFPTSSVPHY